MAKSLPTNPDSAWCSSHEAAVLAGVRYKHLLRLRHRHPQLFADVAYPRPDCNLIDWHKARLDAAMTQLRANGWEAA